MKLKTPIPIHKSAHKIDLKEPMLTIGSCFSDSIGDHLKQNKFDVLVNPFGVIFDPLSITRLLSYSINNKLPDDPTYVQSQGVYKNLEFHSIYRGASQNELALKIQAQLKSVHNFLKTAKWLIISLGTAHVYQYKKTGAYIANCQKLPQENFAKQLIDLKTLRDNLEKILDQLQSFNPTLKIILTVSPIRHLSDGFEENNLSKSTLRILCNDIISENKSVYYYPAFEIMMDDLRDYRFYKADMIHPSDQAIEYIWQHFQASLMNEPTQQFIKEWSTLRDALAHKAFNPTTDEHQHFLQKTLQNLRQLSSVIDMTREIASLEEQLIKS